MLTLSIQDQVLAVVRLKSASHLPEWAIGKGFYSITRTEDELSIVCAEAQVPEHVQAVKGWIALKVEGPLDFSLTGVLSSLADPLAKGGVSIFVISTYDTDYILVKKENVKKAVKILSQFCKFK